MRDSITFQARERVNAYCVPNHIEIVSHTLSVVALTVKFNLQECGEAWICTQISELFRGLEE